MKRLIASLVALALVLTMGLMPVRAQSSWDEFPSIVEQGEVYAGMTVIVPANYGTTVEMAWDGWNVEILRGLEGESLKDTYGRFVGPNTFVWRGLQQPETHGPYDFSCRNTDPSVQLSMRLHQGTHLGSVGLFVTDVHAADSTGMCATVVRFVNHGAVVRALPASLPQTGGGDALLVWLSDLLSRVLAQHAN